MELLLYNSNIPATEDFLKNIKRLWRNICQRESHQAIKDKTQAGKAQKQSTIQPNDLVMLSTRYLVLKLIERKLKVRFRTLSSGGTNGSQHLQTNPTNYNVSSPSIQYLTSITLPRRV